MSEYTTTQPHYADDCGFERCEHCGCCAHGMTQRVGCPVDDLPRGYRCLADRYPGTCGCVGLA